MDHNIIWTNTASGQGGDLYVTGGNTYSQAADYNDYADQFGSLWIIGSGNLNSKPEFANAVHNDYRLLKFPTVSACIDAGDPVLALYPQYELDGDPRVADGRIDIGAYEYSNAERHPADTTTDPPEFVLDADEYNDYQSKWQQGSLDTNGHPIPADYLTRAGYLLQAGGEDNP